MNVWVKYSCEYYDEVTKEIKEDSGIVIANSLSEAAKRIEEYYSDILVTITELQFSADSDTYVIPCTLEF